MIPHRLFSLLLIFFLGSFIPVSNNVQGKTSPSTSNIESQSRYDKTKLSESKASLSQQEKACIKVRRPLNPSATPQTSETVLDRYFRLAYNAEVAGDFDTAIINYRKANSVATCDCDRSHARAGEQAGKEAKALFKTEGEASKPTQFFWGRLQELTRSLSCVIVQ